MSEQKYIKVDSAKLKVLTPIALQVYKDNGILEQDPQKSSANNLELYLDKERLRKVLDVTFQQDFSSTDISDIDLGAVAKGINLFLLQLSGFSNESGK